MARKTAEETEQTRLKLIESGARMFARYGYAYSTLDDIAQCAGLSRGAVYWHFKGKGELLQLILGASSLPLEDFIAPGTALAQGFEQLGRALVETLSVGRYRDLFTILLKEGDTESGQCPVVARWQLVQDNLQEQFKRLLVVDSQSGKQTNAQAQVMRLAVTGLLFESLFSQQSAESLAHGLVCTLLERTTVAAPQY
ncbi:TetR family transcriptional regulator [Pseudomonas sp. dw_358]|uniref:TetR family transcriptional regulator n=1 Tax=Pseudomonas sp. dw_358 TaxID=2720083 RepID=UPI001BD33FBE|nr:TetR family transcriptional regulator [Pseudomonas sp. dw_358]